MDFYVDNTATGANNGTSWTDAWETLSFSGLAAGDTVYISGGPSGSTQTYNLSGELSSVTGYTEGTTGNPVTYKIGQDSSHNGTAIFNRSTTGTQFMFRPSYVVVSGDAGDGVRHFKITNYNQGFTLQTDTEFRFSYIDLGNSDRLGSINPGTKVEIDHCYIRSENLDTTTTILSATFSGAGFDVNKIHNNTIMMPRSYLEDGLGPDAFACGGDAFSIYENTVITYSAVYTAGAHQDGWQAGGNCQYIKIYSNYFENISNYCVFPECVNGGYEDMYIYNNVCVLTAGNSTQAIAVSSKNGYPITNVVVANNLADGYSIPFTFRNPTLDPDPTGFISCLFVNNIAVDSGANLIDPNVTDTNNINLTAEQSLTQFRSYLEGYESNDYHLTGSSSLAIDLGTDRSSNFTTDKDRILRPQDTAWDIGPYEFLAPALIRSQSASAALLIA